MKKSIVAIVLLVTGAVGHAGPLDYVCGMKRTQQEVNSCVALVVNGGTVRMKKNYERIAASSKIPYDQKSGIPANHEEWAANVDKKKKLNNSCASLALRLSDISPHSL
jgi:hypothetical protein